MTKMHHGAIARIRVGTGPFFRHSVRLFLCLSRKGTSVRPGHVEHSPPAMRRRHPPLKCVKCGVDNAASCARGHQKLGRALEKNRPGSLRACGVTAVLRSIRNRWRSSDRSGQNTLPATPCPDIHLSDSAYTIDASALQKSQQPAAKLSKLLKLVGNS